MPKFRPLPSQQELHRLFDYSVVTGALYWKVRTAQCVQVGSVAGSRYNASNVFYVTIKGERYLVHRVIWVWVTGEDPGALEIDHINGLSDCNAFHNLRPATRLQNMNNRRKARGYWKRGNRWVAEIRSNYERFYLGRFDTEAEARAAYEKASRDLRGEFSSIR